MREILSKLSLVYMDRKGRSGGLFCHLPLAVAGQLDVALRHAEIIAEVTAFSRDPSFIHAPIPSAAYHEGMTARRKPLLAPGNEGKWAKINRADAEQLRASNMALTPTQRLELGQKLSQQAVSLLAASVKAGNVPRRALWS